MEWAVKEVLKRIDETVDIYAIEDQKSIMEQIYLAVKEKYNNFEPPKE